jgi:orotate phosphoribosyltransferase
MTAYKVKTKGKNLYLRVAKGHFATGRSHSNYFIDVTVQKSRLSEASALAKEIAAYYTKNTIVDTILCLDEMQVVGTCLADELTNGDFMNMNAHQTIYVVTPEQTSGNQLLFRDSLAPMIEGKHVLILSASVTTGYAASSAVEAVKYYGGYVAGIASIFSSISKCAGYDVRAAFDTADLDGYVSYAAHECPLCREGKAIDALVNGFGYSKL